MVCTMKMVEWIILRRRLHRLFALEPNTDPDIGVIELA